MYEKENVYFGVNSFNDASSKGETLDLTPKSESAILMECNE